MELLLFLHPHTIVSHSQHISMHQINRHTLIVGNQSPEIYKFMREKIQVLQESICLSIRWENSPWDY